MKPMLVPVSMLVSRGAGVTLVAGVVGLLIVWALANRADPTTRPPTGSR